MATRGKKMPGNLQEKIKLGEDKRESRVEEIVRHVIVWAFILGLSTFAIILFARC